MNWKIFDIFSPNQYQNSEDIFIPIIYYLQRSPQVGK